jgi:hypothetical protein
MYLFSEVSTADCYHVGGHSEAEAPGTRLSVRIHTWEPQPARASSIHIHIHVHVHTCVIQNGKYTHVQGFYKSELTWKNSPSHRWTHEHVARYVDTNNALKYDKNWYIHVQGIIEPCTTYMYAARQALSASDADLPLLLQWLHQVVAQTVLLPGAFQAKTRSKFWEVYSLQRQRYERH